MNIARNMEAIIIAAVIAFGIIGAATSSTPSPTTARASNNAVEASTDMPVVVITGKRMTDAEKKAPL